MPFSPEQRQRVIDAIKSHRLRLESPASMYAGYGTGRACDGCGAVIDQTQVEYECVYRDGASAYLHLGCAGLLDAEQRRVVRIQQAREDAETLEDAQAACRKAQATAKNSAQLGDRADVLAREAEAVRERARQVKRGALPPGPQRLPLSLQGARVLLVEDHDDTREVLSHVLTVAGARVVDAATAIDALPLVALCDIVVTDLAMSGRDGRWLLRQMEAGPRRVPIIALTAYSEAFDLESTPGFDSVIKKPVDPEQLVTTVLEVLDRHREIPCDH